MSKLIYYVILTIIFTYPVAFSDNQVPGCCDVYQFLWNLWWFKKTSESSYMYYGEFDKYSADILGFFIPAGFHPIFGNFVDHIYSNFTGNEAEYTTFIGYTVLFLTIFSIIKIKTKEIKFWTLSVIIFFIFILGPILHVNGKLLDYIPLPYSIIMNIPIISIARVPSRWDVLVMLSLAVLAGYGLNYLFREYHFNNKMLAIIFSSLILFEYLAIPYPMSSTKIPNFYDQLRSDHDDYTILEIPFEIYEANHMYFQVYHEKRLIDGYVSRMPLDALKFKKDPFLNQLSTFSNDTIIDNNYRKDILDQYNIKYIILHDKYMNKDQISFADKLLHDISEEKQIYKNDQLIIYKVKNG